MPKRNKHKIEVADANPGRPTKYDAKIARKVLDRISNGELLINIAKDEDMPTARQFRYWLETRDALTEPHARARRNWAEAVAERILDLAQNPMGNFIDENGNKLPLSNAEVQQRRLEVDTLKWFIGKYAPRTYGEHAEPPEPEEKITKIVRTIVDSPRAAAPVPVPGEPLQIGYTPKLPAPGDLPSPVQARLRGIFQARVKSRYENPYADFDEICTVIDAALAAHYGT